MPDKSRNIVVRNAHVDDISKIIDLSLKVYPGFKPYRPAVLMGQITNYNEGTFVVEVDGEIVAYSASLRIAEDKALKPHNWNKITGGGFGTTHEKDGEYLYGYETFVDPDIRGNKIGERLYNARKQLARYLRLKGIVFAGRVPNFAKRKKKNQIKTIQEYVDKVKSKKLRDSTLGFQIRNGFEIVDIFEDYLPDDKGSEGYAVLMVWNNPEYKTADLVKDKFLPKNIVRVATVQYQQRGINSFEEFETMVEYFVDVSSSYKSDFVVFPELFTMQLLSIENAKVPPHKSIEMMTKYTDQFKDMLHRLSMRYNINIIGGSHPTKVGDLVKNISYVSLRDGQMHEQPKIHPTPNERYWWNISGDEKLNVINTDCGPIGVLICYDSEFPELSRHLVNQGVQILFVPFLTDERQSYLRVRYCCQARAVENQMYVVMSGNVGNLPRVQNLDIQYAQSCILTPCDFPFARDGIAADTSPNVEAVAFADLRMDNLLEARNNGTVQNLKDRNHDLYAVEWKGKS